MESSGIVRMLFLVAVLMVMVQSQSWLATADVAPNSKYQIECTMCSACDNPCNQVLSPPPPIPSPPPPPPPPSPPPPSSTSSNCPPPPSPPSNPTYYYSPPPPSQPTYVYSSPPPPYGYPGGGGGGGGGGGAFYPPPYQNYPAPPPPNPIVPYFPFWYHSPPLPSAANSVYFPDATIYTIALISLFFCFL